MTHLEAGLTPEMQMRLELLRAVPPRDPAAAAAGKARFLAEAQALRTDVSTGLFQRLINGLKLSQPRMRRTLRTAFAVLVLAFAATTTVSASQNALPGDRLYPVKLGVESFRLAVSSNPASMFRLHLALAGERITEMERLLATGRAQDLGGAVDGFESQLSRSLTLLASLTAQGDPQVQTLTDELNASLAEFAERLAGLTASAPAVAQPALQGALDAAMSPVETQDAEDDTTGQDSGEDEAGGEDNSGDSGEEQDGDPNSGPGSENSGDDTGQDDGDSGSSGGEGDEEGGDNSGLGSGEEGEEEEADSGPGGADEEEEKEDSSGPSDDSGSGSGDDDGENNSGSGDDS